MFFAENKIFVEVTNTNAINFIKKIVKIFGGLKKVSYFCARRDGRVVDCGGLENR